MRVPIMQDEPNLFMHRVQIRNVQEFLKTFTDLNQTIPVGAVLMFLTVALNEGLSQGELVDKSGIKKSTASRYLLDLSDKTRTGDQGYGLVKGEIDPDELRRKMYSLSPKGRKIIQKLIRSGANIVEN